MIPWLSESEIPERTSRPYAQIDALTESPGCAGLKRTNKSEYLTAQVDIQVVARNAIEELDGVYVRLIDTELRYAVVSMPEPFMFIQIFPRPIEYFQEDKFHRARLGLEAWFAVPANYRRK